MDMVYLIHMLSPVIRTLLYTSSDARWVLAMQLDLLIVHLMLIYALAQALVVGRR
jgi:hypothetical protein